MEWFSLNWFDWYWVRNLRWEYPQFLYLLPLVPALFWLRSVMHRTDKQYIKVSGVHRSYFMNWVTLLRLVPPTLSALSLALALVAVARPQTVTTKIDRFSEGIDIMLAVDISESMLERDLQPTRLAAAKKVAQRFVENRLQDRIGLVIFAGEAYSICPLTTDYDLLKQYIEDLQTSMIPEAGTAIGSALAVAINRMRDSNGQSKVVILLSDGDNTSGNLDPFTMSKLAQAYGIRIYTIAVGRAGGASSNVSESVLQRIAGENQFFRATDNTALGAVFSQINQLEKVKYKDSMYSEVKDYYRVYLMWSVVLFIISLGLKSTFMANVLED
ncbi:VWA domain-containing protein [Ravibacter arvi]|uniref:VWA domain-containing protein n=1 Tax=Ravibacter arvi TaxID=2051041 RepID=A0ABP8MA87_9BACT